MGRTTRSKLTATALSALAAGSVIGIGMATTTASAASPVSFTYWTSAWGASEIATLDSQFDAANPGYKANGEYIAQSDEYLPKVIAAIKSGTYPTVLVDQNPSDLPLLEQSGKLLPLNSDLTSLTNALYPGIKASLFYRGEQLGMALAEEGDIALFYNKTDFAQAGIPVPPSNWSQLAADAIKLTVLRLGAGPVGQWRQLAQCQPDQGHLRQRRRRVGVGNVGQPRAHGESRTDGELRNRRQL
jgi:ABC-type glycerol-3-phosphate transport system substrate-binding protein